MAEEYLKAIELKPDYAEAYLKLGNWYEGHDHYEKGYEAINKAISLKPDYAEAYCSLGFAYIQKKFGDGHRLAQTEEESTKAVDAFGKALQIKPDFVLANVGLGIAKNYLGQLNEALQAFKQAASLDPNDALSHMGIGDYYIELGDKPAAMKEYEALMRIASEEKAALKEHGIESNLSLAEGYAQVLLKQIKERFDK
jgi:protein O-GlcNAc transferase